MILSNHFLWAGLLILIVDLIHLINQKRLRDKQSRFFAEIIIKGLIICGLGIALTEMRKNPNFSNENLYMFLLSCRYFIQSTVPFSIIMITSYSMYLKKDLIRKIMLLSTTFLAFSAIVCASNYNTKMIAYLDASNNLCPGPFFTTFFVANMVLYLFVIMYIMFNRNNLNKIMYDAMLTACLISLFGTFAQYFLGIQFFFGLALAIAISSMHLTINNPSRNIDQGTGMFNRDYFFRYLREKYVYDKKGYLMVIDLYYMKHIGNVYAKNVVSNLLYSIADFLWQIDIHHQVFSLRDDRFAIYVKDEKDLEMIKTKVIRLLEEDIAFEDRQISCPAHIILLKDMFELKNVETLSAYVEYIYDNRPDNMEGVTYVDEDTVESKEGFKKYRTIERYLDEAIRNDYFEVWYQPLYDTKTQKIYSVEALSRLYHKEIGWISPELFIKIACDSGQILKIMPLQMHRICRYVKENMYLLDKVNTIKINLTPRELFDHSYCDKLIDIIRSYGLPLEFFQFEVTETMAVNYSSDMKKCIKKMETVGIGLCLDDFGSGYANLNLIFNMPFHTVKLDRSLLAGILHNKNSQVLYETIAKTLSSLGYVTVAEGVESKEEFDFLFGLNVDLIQGYYFSRPLPPKKLLDILN